MKAVVLFNLGGPSSIKDVKGFLFNIFNDPAILRLPNPFRYILAKFISAKREKEARLIYQQLGGGSPIVHQTLKQRDALNLHLGPLYDVYICMRYWLPSIEEVIEQIRNKNYEEIILLPLYPQFSTTTTESFFYEWERISRNKGFQIPLKKICCYPSHPGFIESYQLIINQFLNENKIPPETRFLFSAHGLPEKIVKAGDPYPFHVEKSVRYVLKGIPQIKDWVITYQSKVGPLKWLEPSTESEIKKAAKDKKPIAIIPISFVSEHSETLYELDILYKNLAIKEEIPAFYRLPTLQDSPLYINCLVDLIKSATFNPCGLPYCRESCP